MLTLLFSLILSRCGAHEVTDIWFIFKRQHEVRSRRIRFGRSTVLYSYNQQYIMHQHSSGRLFSRYPNFTDTLNKTEIQNINTGSIKQSYQYRSMILKYFMAALLI